MGRAARILNAVSTVASRTRLVAVGLVAVTLLGWTLFEVVPRYAVERHRDQGPKRLDHPTFLIGDCAYYRATLVSLLEDRDLDVANNLIAERYSLPSNVARGRHVVTDDLVAALKACSPSTWRSSARWCS